MKDKKPVTTPNIFPCIDVDTNSINEITPDKMNQFKKSKAYKNAVIPAIKRENRRRTSIKIAWLKKYFIDLTALVISIASLVVSIIVLLQ